MTIIFCEAILEENENLKSILCCFTLVSGLQINYDTELIRIRVSDCLLDSMAEVFGCKVGMLPTKYLGLPLRMGIPKRIYGIRWWKGLRIN